MGPTFSSVAPLVALLSALYFQQVSPVLKKVTSDSYVRKKKKKEKKEIIFDYINPLPGHRVLIQLREWD